MIKMKPLANVHRERKHNLFKITNGLDKHGNTNLTPWGALVIGAIPFLWFLAVMNMWPL